MNVGEIVLIEGESALCIDVGVDYAKFMVFTKSGGSYSAVVNRVDLDRVCKRIDVGVLGKLAVEDVEYVESEIGLSVADKPQ